MTQLPNQFAITQQAGEPDLQFIGSVVTARVSANQGTALVPGQAVKRDTTVTNGLQGLPYVIGMTANLDTPWGIVLRNLKDQSNPARSTVEIARDNSVVYMTASAAIPAGVPVEIDFTAFTVKQWAGLNDPIGESYDQAVNNGDLIRVWLKLPNGSIDRKVQTIDVVATLAQINAGLSIIPGEAGQSIRVLGYNAKVVGTFATGTSVELESDSTSVAVTTILEAALVGAANLFPWSANNTLGVGFGGTALPAGEGLKVANNGSAQTGGTSIEFVIQFQQF